MVQGFLRHSSMAVPSPLLPLFLWKAGKHRSKAPKDRLLRKETPLTGLSHKHRHQLWKPGVRCVENHPEPRLSCTLTHGLLQPDDFQASVQRKAESLGAALTVLIRHGKQQE